MDHHSAWKHHAGFYTIFPRCLAIRCQRRRATINSSTPLCFSGVLFSLRFGRFYGPFVEYDVDTRPNTETNCCHYYVAHVKYSMIFIYLLHFRNLSKEQGAPPCSSGSVLHHISLPPGFESRSGHIWRLFQLWLRLINFGGRSAHLAYHVHKMGRKTQIISHHHQS